MTVDRVIHSVRRADAPAGAPVDGWVAFDAGVVSHAGTGDGWRALAPRDAVDGGGALLVPGYVDIHGHGGARASFDDGPEAVAAGRALHRAHGTTRAVVSLVTASVADLAVRAAMVADLVETDATILGSHLEGPFLDAGHKGAHTESLLRAPAPADIDLLLEAGRGTIRQVTLAPELEGGMEAVRRFVDAGVAVAVGHTDADYETAQRAFDAGATILTHAFNAMPGIRHRAPGPISAALHDERVTLELIADGIHVHPAVMRIAFASARTADGRTRIALITDAMAAAGAGDGHYVLGGLAVDVEDGVARLAGGGSIAGSTLTQDAAVRRAVREVGVPLADAVSAATSVPAGAIGRGHDLGSLHPGFLADALLLDDDLGVTAVWIGGEPD
ncbi:N-acetylglucosamine-6-phosphate deacetylase [Microbacterium sp. ASV49]|uniref:N-acetylglucosamine-6-phosphate deacetylase n=1 Tax=Microbacterium candidum TaxID=3041922 RepID=A0ABT7MWY8_9MICO|nr:N-acetylglucosamine-6-phosphate deacetylase [Microbacterium sp. ASV49]MDL9978963.1 N-acetylglucosamine-6-phosphate deacetylase [Microbacterium sp. ASV49]